MSGNGVLAFIAIAALAAGSLVYLLDRPPASVYLLPGALSFHADSHSLFGGLGRHLPDFVHVYAFILLTVAVSRSALVWPVCVFWWALDSLMELGQHPVLAPQIAAALPAWFQHIPILENTGNYLRRGTFDPGDLLALALGAGFAYVTIGIVRQRDRAHVLKS